ncbi:MAG: hypothetical protein ABIT23_10980, partial [Nitrosospira sp.]
CTVFAAHGCVVRNVLEWNGHSKTLRLAPHPKNRTLHLLQLPDLGLTFPHSLSIDLPGVNPAEDADTLNVVSRFLEFFRHLSKIKPRIELYDVSGQYWRCDVD